MFSRFVATLKSWNQNSRAGRKIHMQPATLANCQKSLFLNDCSVLNIYEKSKEYFYQEITSDGVTLIMSESGVT